MAIEQRFYTVREVAEMTSLTDRTIRNYLKDGRLKGIQVGGKWRFTAEDISAFYKPAGELSAALKGVGAQTSPGSCEVCAEVRIGCDATSARSISSQLCDRTGELEGTRVSYEYKHSTAIYTLSGDIAPVIELLGVIRSETSGIDANERSAAYAALCITPKEHEQILGAVFESLSPLRLKVYSSKRKKQLVTLDTISRIFTPGREYTESEVNELLAGIYSDYATLRRELVEYGYLTRDRGGRSYRVSKG